MVRRIGRLAASLIWHLCETAVMLFWLALVIAGAVLALAYFQGVLG